LMPLVVANSLVDTGVDVKECNDLLWKIHLNTIGP